MKISKTRESKSESRSRFLRKLYFLRMLAFLCSIFYVAIGLASESTVPGKSFDTYEVDTVHSRVGFSVKHMMITEVHGDFKEYKGSIELFKGSLKPKKVEGWIDVNSIDTDNKKRDQHLRSPDFFDVKKYPKIFYSFTKYKGSEKKGKVWGKLTMHGVTKEIVLDVVIGGIVKDPWGGKRLGLEVSGMLNRKDFGLKWNKVLDGGGLVVADKVKLKLSIQAIYKKQ